MNLKNIAKLTFIFLCCFYLKSSFSQEQSNQAIEANELVLEKIDSSRFYSKAVLQVLNKTTAKSSIEEVNIGSSIKIGKLTIFVQKCWQSPPEQRPDSKILLKIIEEQQIDKIIENKIIFYGWMISSSPSISSLEHPIYDVVALSCKR